MTVLVTGATGFIGGALVRSLTSRGESVRALIREISDPEAVARLRATDGVEVVRGELADRESLRVAAAGCRATLHAAGDYRGDADAMWAAHADGTAALLDAVEPGSRVVLVSSTSVYGWGREWPADESTPPKPVSPYGLAKLAAEERVLAWTRGQGVVARTTIVYGPGDTSGMLVRATSLLRAGWRWFPGDGTNRIHLTHIDDLVPGLSALTDDGDGVYLFAGPRAEPVAAILGGLAERLGVRPPVFVGRTAAARVAARAARAVLGGDRSPLDAHTVEVLTEDRCFAPERAGRELGWKPSIGLEAGLDTLVRPMTPATTPGPEWERFVSDPDEGIGSVYERFLLAELIDHSLETTGSKSVLHAPMFGMTGVPGLDAIFQARRGIDVALLDVDADRLAAVERLWSDLGCSAETYLAPWPDTRDWPGVIPADAYDLVVSFAALWWCTRPEEVLAAQARWARKAVLLCIPNRNIFTEVRARFWHSDMFDHLNRDMLDPEAVVAAATAAGLDLVDTGLFDIPPFPDTAISIKQLIPALARIGNDGGRNGGDRNDEGDEGTHGASATGAWRWEILSYLRGQDPELEQRMKRLRILEHRAGPRLANRLAHHRYWLFTPAHGSANHSR